jgi:hypothetical protein
VYDLTAQLHRSGGLRHRLSISTHQAERDWIETFPQGRENKFPFRHRPQAKTKEEKTHRELAG